MSDLEARLVEVLRSVPAVRAAWLFGSVAEGRTGPLSDVDVAVLGISGLDLDERARLVESLGRAAGRRCDLVCVENASPVLGMEIVRAGRRLLATDVDAADHWEDFALRRYLGTAQLRKANQQALRDDLLGDES